MFINWNETMKKENKSFFKECIIILFVGIIVNVACFFLCSITGHCENEFYPVSTGVNAPLGAFTEQEILEMCNNYSAFPSDYYYVIRVTASPNNVYPLNARYDVIVFDKSLYNTEHLSTFPIYIEVSNDGYFQFHLNPLYDNDLYNVKMYYMQSYSGTTSDLQLRAGAINNLSAYSPLVDNKTTYYFNISVPKDYVTNNEYVLKYTETINVGDFSELPGIDEILNNISNSWQPPSSVTGHALPSSPTENPNNTPFQERKEFFEYIANTITQNFGNLGYNLANWFNGLQQKLTEGFNSVSQNVYNGFKTLMDNIKDFFGSKLDFIIDKFNYITEPLSLEELTTNLNNGSFSSDLLGVIVSVESFKSSFTAGSEPNSCTFTLDFTNAFYNFGVCTFSLDWLLPIRPIIRLFLGVLCLYSLIVSIFTSLNTYIGGTSSINDDI